MDIFSIEVEWDEGGCCLILDGEERHRLVDPEQAYNAMKVAVEPWLYERDAARIEYDRARRQNDTRQMSEEEFSAYLDDAYGDDWSKREGMKQMREQGYA